MVAPPSTRSGSFADKSFWSAQSRASCAVVFVCMGLLNVEPVLNAVGAPLAVIAVLLAVFDPFAAFLFIAASQISPDPPGLPLTLAQLFVAAYAVSIPFSGVMRGLQSIPTSLRYTAIFFLCWLLVAIMNDTLDWDFVYAIILAAIAASFIPLMGKNYFRALWMLGAGAALGILGHWGREFGLPMVGILYEHEIRGGARFGSGRGDVNWASVNVAFGLWTLLALLIPLFWTQGARARNWAAVMAGFLFVAGAVPLLVMGSRAGLAYLVLGGLFLALYLLATRRFSARFSSVLLSALIAVIVLGPLLWLWFIETEPGERLMATLAFNSVQAQEYGQDEGVAGRSNQWIAFMNIAAQYPLTGVPKGAVVDFGEYGVATIGGVMEQGSGAGGSAHNVWLDFAAGRGIPVSILFLIAFTAPMIALWQRQGAAYAMPFAMAHAVVFLVFMNLSVAGYKTYWALHVLTAAAAYVPRRRPLAPIRMRV